MDKLSDDLIQVIGGYNQPPPEAFTFENFEVHAFYDNDPAFTFDFVYKVFGRVIFKIHVYMNRDEESPFEIGVFETVARSIRGNDYFYYDFAITYDGNMEIHPQWDDKDTLAITLESISLLLPKSICLKAFEDAHKAILELYHLPNDANDANDAHEQANA